MHVRTVFVLLCCLLPACTWWTSREQILVSSEPLGARIAVDGQDTGKTTPTALPIGGFFGFDHEIVLTKKGYRPARVQICQYTEGYSSKWIDGVYGPVMLPLPLFWTPGDTVFPFGIRSAVIPAEVRLVLEREDAPKLGFDVLAERAAKAAGAGDKQ
ncbi:MAG: PEGA domain-containing protein [Planctomycetota bacterium]